MTRTKPMATLIGPPEASNYNPKAPPKPTTTTAKTSGFKTISPPLGFTENLSPTFLSSGNPCLDFFFHIVPDTPSDSLRQRLSVAWSHNPLTTLKLVCNLRGVRGTGKSDRKGFYAAATWLFFNHPKTLAANVPSFAEFGFFKDLPEILCRLLEGSDVRKNQKAQWRSVKGSNKRNKCKRIMERRSKEKDNKKKESEKKDNKKKELLKKRTLGDFLVGLKSSKNLRNEIMMDLKEFKMEMEIKTEEEEDEEEEETARVIRKQKKASARSPEEKKASARSLREKKKVSMANKLLNRYNNDAHFRLLHDSISNHFANCLKNDLELLNSGKLTDISLAAKWCPSLDSSFDRSTLLCETIARRIFPREGNAEYEGIEEAHYAYRIRDRLRKEVLVPLRKVLELPEVYIGQNRWDLIPYNRVASVAMKFYKEKFLKHDKERFEKYLKDVKSGKSTIATGALFPHEIIASLGDGDGGEVAELQWRRMVSDMLSKGRMKNSLAVCDVSGSMCGVPMEVSVALGLLLSELSEEPWKGKVITFSANPQLHLIQGDDLSSKTDFIRRMEWGMNTNFQRVFDRILEVAVNGKLKTDQMIKRVFVFSDMEFDRASTSPWETDYKVITRKYSEKGYGNAVPQIVFWNLRDSRATPVPSTQQGVALVSGFSKNMMKLFMDSDGDINPEASMEAAISGPEYQKLVVLD
ncbi:hypothetical protein PIB30_076884 [Stylosanthes scabra]|uniref:Plant/T31B5-30 protein n=1 Tax=Stylosanthes scabra TaxID=79078 RepID=A0ABU6RQU7_9FABA|nr:hypothetical protein [Stylosanthes scabra]